VLTLIGGRQEIELTREDVEALIRVEGPLKKMGLSLVCQRCHAFGNPDGVRAANSPSDSQWMVECGCTVRLHRRHAPPT